MFEFLRARLRLGRSATTPIPPDPSVLPERFRGRPVLQRSDGASCDELTTNDRECLAGAPSSFVRIGERGLPVLDLGSCLFAPEEAVDCGQSQVVFTRDYRMAARTRDALVTTDGEVTLAHALDKRARRLFGRSLRLRSVAAGSCGGCEAELVALGNVVFDMARFGVQFVASPRHADGIVVTGAVSVNMRVALEKAYEAVPDPRLVIAVGACAIAGGPFRESPEVLGGLPPSIPVDLWIPGCPPHPLTVLDGILRLLGRLEDGERQMPNAAIVATG
ncbi:MAG TPA: NADH-quinone oxidoreductase subunit NuoB [Gemmatimonadaceae bacterium]|nr:NADH-quinone oxidoreductase subunit NuoB [Gemmatimonadaceae bacterium]